MQHFRLYVFLLEVHGLQGNPLEAIPADETALRTRHGFRLPSSAKVSSATVVNWGRTLGLEGLTPGAKRMVEMGVDLRKLPGSQEKLTAAARTSDMSPGSAVSPQSSAL